MKCCLGRLKTMISLLLIVLVTNWMGIAAGSGFGKDLKEKKNRMSRRIVVKVKPSLAKGLEAQLAGQSDEILLSRASNSPTGKFYSKYAPKKMAAVFSDLIRLKTGSGVSDGQQAEKIRQRFQKRSDRQKNQIPVPELSRIYYLEFQADRNLDDVLARLKADPEVEYAKQEEILSIHEITNDPYLMDSGSWGQPHGDLWGLHAIQAPLAWDITQGEGVIVSVVDTGVDYNHPDIAANMLPGHDFCGADHKNPTEDSDPIDDNGHGTHVAGTIAAVGNNNEGIVGVAWKAKILPVKAGDREGWFPDICIIKAIRYAADHGADVINASFGGAGSCSPDIHEAIQYAAALGVVFVGAAGNEGSPAVSQPANDMYAIAVGALDPNGSLAWFSNYSSRIDVTAPGMAILSLRAAGTSLGHPLEENNLYTWANGTSMAAPHVAGLAALIIAQHPTYTTEEVRQVLRTTANDAGDIGWDSNFGYGIIDALDSLTLPNVLQARIFGPETESVIRLTPISVVGSAQGNNFYKYVLDYGIGALPSNWTELKTSYTPHAAGELALFGPIPNNQYTLRLTAYDTAGRMFVDRVVITTKIKTVNDFDGNGKSDLAWKNSVSGEVYVMPLDGHTVLPGNVVYTESDLAWKIIGQGDHNDDGRQDIFWWNRNSGQVNVMFMNGLQVLYYYQVFREANTAWVPQFVTDFNGDGFADILWRNNTTGDIRIVRFYSGFFDEDKVIYNEPDSQWKIVMAADFDADQKSDILWWHSGTGKVFQMLMNGTAIKSQALIYTEPNTNWSIVGSGDFDCNGRADILWKNSSSGQIYEMPLNGSTILPGAIIHTEQNPAWQIVAIGDYDGDKKSDIVWWNSTTGQVYQMLMDGTAIKSQALIYTEPNTAWKIN